MVLWRDEKLTMRFRKAVPIRRARPVSQIHALQEASVRSVRIQAECRQLRSVINATDCTRLGTNSPPDKLYYFPVNLKSQVSKPQRLTTPMMARYRIESFRFFTESIPFEFLFEKVEAET